MTPRTILPHTGGTMLVILLALAAVGGRGGESDGRSDYRLKLPHHMLEYKVPPVLQMGYGRLTSELDLDQLTTDAGVFRLGKGAYQKPIVTFWGKIRMGALSRPAEASFELSVIKLDGTAPPIQTAEQLSEYLRGVFSTKTKLKDGSEIETVGPLQFSTLQGRDVVLITSADMTRVREYELPQPAGAFHMVSPRHRFFIRLDERVLFCLSVTHFTEKHFNERWYDKAISIAEEILKSVKFTPTSLL